MSEITYLSIFSGIEAASVAFEPLGWKPLAFCEIDPFPSATLARNYPDVVNLGDIRQVDWHEFVKQHGRPSVLIGGSPCFTAGTLVLCDSGFKPIEDICVGDFVVTHKGNLKKVVRVGSRSAEVGDLKVHGMMTVTCTPTHPILTSERTKCDKDENGWWFRFGGESFVDAKDSPGLAACSITKVQCPIPDFPDVYGLPREDVMELIGWYLGDGCIATKGRRNPTIRSLQLTISPKKLVRFVIAFKQKLQYRVTETDQERCTVHIYNTELCRFIEKWFGKGAENKNIPAWVYALPRDEQMRLFKGYVDTDGYTYDDGRIIITSVSKKLIIGIQMLLGEGSANANSPREKRVIKGVEYNVKPNYAVSYREGHSRCWLHNGYAKRLILSYGNMRVDTVYNIEVEDDHSYTANGIAVHNCQSFSIAGGRESLNGESRLMFEYIRAVGDIRPPYFIWENTPGVLSTRDNAFGQFLKEMVEIGYRDISYRVLDAQFFGLAQRRKRVFVVGHLAESGFRSAAVLDLASSSARDTQKESEKREALAVEASGGTGTAGEDGCLTPWDVQSRRVYADESESWPTLYAGEGGGHGYVASDDGTTPTLTNSDSYVPAVAFAQNQRDEVRLIGGDGQTAGALTAQRWGNHKNETLLLEPVVMASGQAHAEISRGGVAPTIAARNYKDPPLLFEQPNQ